MPPQDNWPEWREKVLSDLQRLSSKQDEILKQLSDQQSKIAGLEIRAGFWGALAGAVPLLISFLLNKK